MSGKRKASTARNADLPKTSTRASPDSTDEVACPQEPRRFVMMPQRVIGDNRLKRAHFQVLTCILRARRDDGWCVIGLDRIAEVTNYSRRQTVKTISDLIEWGYLDKVDRGRTERGTKKTNAYAVLYEPAHPESANSRLCNDDDEEPRQQIADMAESANSLRNDPKPSQQMADGFYTVPFNPIPSSSGQDRERVNPSECGGEGPPMSGGVPSPLVDMTSHEETRAFLDEVARDLDARKKRDWVEVHDYVFHIWKLCDDAVIAERAKPLIARVSRRLTGLPDKKVG